MGTPAGRSLPRLMLETWKRSIICRQSTRTLSSSAPEGKSVADVVEPHEEVMTAEEVVSEEDNKPGWVMKGLGAYMLCHLLYNAFPIIDEGIVRHPIALLKAKDSFFWRSGASRLALLAKTTESKRKQIVEKGGIVGLVRMLNAATDTRTRRAALKALAALCVSDIAIAEVEKTEIRSIVATISETAEYDSELVMYMSTLMDRIDSHKKNMTHTDTDADTDSSSLLAAA